MKAMRMFIQLTEIFAPLMSAATNRKEPITPRKAAHMKAYAVQNPEVRASSLADRKRMRL